MWLENLRRTFLDWNAMAEILPIMLTTGLKNTLILAFASTIIGIFIGIVLAVMGISRSKWLRVPARVYTDIFRGLPAIVTILLIGQGFAGIGRELFGPSPYPLGILALSLIAGSYIGEIFRAGIQSVPTGQMEACRALSMSYGQGMRLIVVPQGIRRVLPALVNQFISNVKDSSLIYFLGLLASEREIFRVGQDAAVVTGNLSPLLLAGIFYLVITVPLTHLINYFDHRLRAGKRPSDQQPASGLEEVDELNAVPRNTSETTNFNGGSLSIEGLRLSYGDMEVLRGIDLEVLKNSVTCVIGPSGSGKSTLLRSLNPVGRNERGQSPFRRLRHPQHEARNSSRKGRHGVPALQPISRPYGAREHHALTHKNQRHESRRGPQHCGCAACGCGPTRAWGPSSCKSFRRAATAGRHCSRFGHGPGSGSVRRGDQRP